MSNYKLVIFDLDGTIADTSPGIFNSIRYAQRMMNLPHLSEVQMRSHVGPPIEESYNRNFGLTGEKLSKAIEYHKEYAVKQGYKELLVYDGIVPLLTTLKKAGIMTAVATLKAHSTAVKIFENLNISDRFNVIIGADPDNPKSKSQMIDHCMNTLVISKSETVLIGDSKYDAIGAEKSGIDFIAVTYGFGFKPNDKIRYLNIGIAHNPSDILPLILGSH